MPIQSPQWAEFLSCPICYNGFESNSRRPISLGCGHTICKSCLSTLPRKQCPFDQNIINIDIDRLPENYALLQLVGGKVPEKQPTEVPSVSKEDLNHYLETKKCIENIALFLKSTSNNGLQNNPLSKPMQRKLVTLVNCQLVEEEGKSRAMRAARSLGERSVTELILYHQNPQQLSANLWAAVRSRGCQFLGPALQEEVLKLILLVLEDGSALCRRVLVMFVVQRLIPRFPQASKTSIGHVVQLLYRASCFKVSKRDGDSSLMQLKEEFRTYDALRREHDAQIVQIATEAGLRIAPEQWSSLLYGDTSHKSHMQSIIDKLQTPQSFSQSIQELVIALQRSGDSRNLSHLRPHLELLASINPSPDAPAPKWKDLKNAQEAARAVVKGLFEFVQYCGNRKGQDDVQAIRYKTLMCRDLTQHGGCPRGTNCTYAHSQEEMERNRAKIRRNASSRASGPYVRNLNTDDSAGKKKDVLPAGEPSTQVTVVNSDTHNKVAPVPDNGMLLHNYSGQYVNKGLLHAPTTPAETTSHDQHLFSASEHNTMHAIPCSSAVSSSFHAPVVLNPVTPAFHSLNANSAETFSTRPVCEQQPVVGFFQDDYRSPIATAILSIISTNNTGLQQLNTPLLSSRGTSLPTPYVNSGDNRLCLDNYKALPPALSKQLEQHTLNALHQNERDLIAQLNEENLIRMHQAELENGGAVSHSDDSAFWLPSLLVEEL